MDIRLFRFFGQMDIRLFYFEVAKYTNGWDVYSIKPSIHQVRRFNRSYHVRLDEYCFCRFRKIIFDSYSKTRKNTQSWIDLFWFRFVLVLSISTTWSLSLLHFVFVFVHTLNKSDKYVIKSWETNVVKSSLNAKMKAWHY